MYIDDHIAEIRKLCEELQVKFLYVFGSVLTADFTDKSDLDFIVDFKPEDPLEYAENYFDLKFRLEDMLNRPVDLLEHRGLKNEHLLKKINNSKKVIYEA